MYPEHAEHDFQGEFLRMFNYCFGHMMTYRHYNRMKIAEKLQKA